MGGIIRGESRSLLSGQSGRHAAGATLPKDLSHLGDCRCSPGVNLAAVCDSTGYVLEVLQKHAGMRTYRDVATLLDSVHLDAHAPSRRNGCCSR